MEIVILYPKRFNALKRNALKQRIACRRIDYMILAFNESSESSESNRSV